MDIILRGLAHVIQRPVCHCLLQYNHVRLLGGNLQQTRNHFILERIYPVQLYKKGKKPYIKSKNYVYKTLKFTECEKLPDIECILTKNIDEIQPYQFELLSNKAGGSDENSDVKDDSNINTLMNRSWCFVVSVNSFLLGGEYLLSGSGSCGSESC